MCNSAASPKLSQRLQERFNSYRKLVELKTKHTQSLSEAFTQDPNRAKRFSRRGPGILFDFSKNHLNTEVLDSLLKIAEEADMKAAIHALLNGEQVNPTEQRPALHSLLRQADLPEGSDKGLLAKQQEVRSCQLKMQAMVDSLRSGQWLGHSARPIRKVVSIGIGGSDLGSRLVVQALGAQYRSELDLFFVASLDPVEMANTLSELDANETLFIIASKSFSTLETLSNFQAAKRWLLAQGCPESQLKQHFIAVSSRPERACAEGVANENILPMWDWVGGRYSLWSAVGLPIAIAIGNDAFQSLLDGAAAMDQHLAEADLADNLPVLAALISFWYSQCWAVESQALLPYCHGLRSLPAWLQQLDMESLGKSTGLDNLPIEHPSGQIIWGSEEPNGQHSFHQLLLQGSHLIPVEFIAPIQPGAGDRVAHRQLLASCISQSQALMLGRSAADAKTALLESGCNEREAETLSQHQSILGNRPSSTLLIDELNPYNLGSLLAFYEHKVYCHSVLLGINAFDQWGVELGKQLGVVADRALAAEKIPADWDGSSRLLAEAIINAQNQ